MAKKIKNRVWNIGTNIKSYLMFALELYKKTGNNDFFLVKNPESDIYKIVVNIKGQNKYIETENKEVFPLQTLGQSGTTIYQFLFILNSLNIIKFNAKNVSKADLLDRQIKISFVPTSFSTSNDISKAIMDFLLSEEFEKRYLALSDAIYNDQKSILMLSSNFNEFDHRDEGDDVDSLNCEHEYCVWLRESNNDNDIKFIFSFLSSLYRMLKIIEKNENFDVNNKKESIDKFNKLYSKEILNVDGFFSSQELKGLKFYDVSNFIFDKMIEKPTNMNEIKNRIIKILFLNEQTEKQNLEGDNVFSIEFYEKKVLTNTDKILKTEYRNVSNNEMDSKIFPFKNFIFSKNLTNVQKAKYKIAAYQRNYKWKKEFLEKLFTDINNIDGKSKTYHYVGTILLNNVEMAFNDIWVLKIVDGQQRLTSLFIILRAFFDHSIRNEIGLKKDIYEVFMNDKSRDDSNELLDTFIRLNSNVDFNSFNYLMKGKFSKIKDKNSDLFYINYQAVRSIMASTLGDDIEKNNRFLSNLLNGTLMTKTLNRTNNEFELFENMNTQKVELETIELIKNMILMNVNENDLDKYENEINNYFEEKIIGEFKNSNDKPSDDISSKINNFIASFVKYYKSEIISGSELWNVLKNAKNNKNDLYNAFKQIIIKERINNLLDKETKKISYESFKEVIDYLNGQIKIHNWISYKKFFLNKENPLYLIGDILFTLEQRKVYSPLIMKIISNGLNKELKFENINSLNEVRKTLLVIENYEMKFQVVSYRGQSLTTLMEKVFEKVNEFGRNTNAEKLSSILSDDSIMNKLKMASDNQFKTSLINTNINDKAATKLIWRMEWYFSNKNSLWLKNMEHTYEAFTKPSREHIMPQNIDEWMNDLRKTNLSNEEIKEKHDEYKEKLGNSLLMSGSLNASASNKNFLSKKERYETHPNFLNTIQNIGIEDQYMGIGEKDKWIFDDIAERTQQMADILINIYKYN